MIRTLSRKTSSFFVKNGVISAEDIEAYEYCLEIMFSSLLGIISVLTISAFSGTLIYAVIFLGAFIPLRMIVGGYHAKTHRGCFGGFVSIYLVFMLIVIFSPMVLAGKVTIISSVMSSGIVFLLAPLSTKNKPISESSRKLLRRKSRNLSAMFFTITIIAIIFIADAKISLSLALGNLSVALTLIAKLCQNKYNEIRGN